MEEQEEYQTGEEIVPIEQGVVLFYGKPVMVVRLPDGRPGVVMLSLCENMQLDRQAQIRRIQRTLAIAGDLIYNVRIETEGGPQKTHVLTLRALTFWLTGIDPKRTRPEMREEVLRYQIGCVDALYSWAQSPRAIAAPSNLVPAEPVTKPGAPAEGAPLSAWHEYHRQMAAFLEWQMDIEEWRGRVDTRLEGVEALAGLVPDIMRRLGPERITPEHQERVQVLVRQLHNATNKPWQTIQLDLRSAFHVPRYEELLEADWPIIERWFLAQIEKATGKSIKQPAPKPKQPGLFDIPNEKE